MRGIRFPAKQTFGLNLPCEIPFGVFYVHDFIFVWIIPCYNNNNSALNELSFMHPFAGMCLCSHFRFAAGFAYAQSLSIRLIEREKT